jgi:hypothetical protein
MAKPDMQPKPYKPFYSYFLLLLVLYKNINFKGSERGRVGSELAFGLEGPWFKSRQGGQFID